MVDGLTGGDAQRFIDAMDEVRHPTLPYAKNGSIYPYISIGVGEPQPLTTGPKEMPKVVIQDVCWLHLASSITAD